MGADRNDQKNERVESCGSEAENLGFRAFHYVLGDLIPKEIHCNWRIHNGRFIESMACERGRGLTYR